MSHDFSPNPGKWLTVGILGLAISFIGFFVDAQIAAWSFLIGLIFVTSIAIGMLFLVMIHHIFDANWSVIVRRQAEHYLSALPYLGILFIPLFALSDPRPKRGKFRRLHFSSRNKSRSAYHSTVHPSRR